jgi:phospholipid/cholesterol/gamma-HCH transport system substrate-binding protein
LRQPLPVVKLLAFAFVGLFCLAYLVFSVVGTKTFAGQYQVRVQLSATGGLFPGSQVTYRGVPVGTVGSITVNPAKTGVVATLDVNSGVKVPVATKAVVADRSPAGEQYLDLQPTGDGAPYLADNATIPLQQTVLPPSLAGLLGSVTSFSNSVNIHELRSVFNELDAALGGTGPALGQLIDNTSVIVTTLESVEPQTVDLLDNAGKLLDTQAAHGADLHQFSVSLRQLADTLRTDDPKTVRLVRSALDTTLQLGPLLRHDAANIAALLGNLVTVGTIVDARLPGLRTLLVTLPAGLDVLTTAVHGSHVDFKLLTQTGSACKYKTRRQQPYIDHKGAPIYSNFCRHPKPTYQQRGAINAPRPPGDTTARPPSGSHGHSAGTSSIRTTGHARAHSGSWLDVFAAGE